MPPIKPVINKKLVSLTRSKFVVDFGEGPTEFSEVVLPSSKAEVLSYREADEISGIARQFPGQINYGPALLRRGKTPSNTFLTWWKTVQAGQPMKRDVLISILDDKNNVVRKFKLVRAWPSRFQPAPLNAKGTDIFMEELELSCERFEGDDGLTPP